ncbi:endonuclease domain-containing protein [Bradyrhizobium elkanii]|uniref:endonuclease domain-containing protein n=1 Tax=Bradyrhizobium elkanii TaxID=29448 RepID=UPI0021688DBC|nr:endonuclease domain-containing protein [Bradyrhizobium elkanii]MCS3521841.1 hypothetical protein [Bradyrhizobium elkanii]MCS4069496.1 hypothetical protein [Bradyrhizobium elkanii]MCS4076126.1 hypothetical protein [Bradyrhizobium elkanii]MDH6687730.1 hypothetical protein [Bradyrhizobium elkanii]
MIENRPASLLADPAYGILPKLPIALDWSSVPELIRVATLDLGGIQPVTKAMAEAAGGTLHDKPSDGEVELFRKRGTNFQLVSIVLSCVPAGEVDNVLQVRPFAMTLIPASKRDKVQESTIDLVANLDVGGWLATEPMYAGYDPFSGEWSLFGNLPGYMDGERKGYLDEMGLVIDQFFLATEQAEDEILTMDIKMPSEQMRSRYEKHRRKLFFTPFKQVEARRVWGAETPIELFVIQALAKEKLFPACQMLIMSDGSTFPSWYHLWNDVEFRHTDGLVTEADLFFSDERVAVFCDGGHHARAKQKAKDTVITEKLAALGIRSIRIPGDEIRNDLPRTVVRIREMLGQT